MKKKKKKKIEIKEKKKLFELQRKFKWTGENKELNVLYI